MAEKSQAQPDFDITEMVDPVATPGWDPYQVWLTRIRPQQLSTQLGGVGAITKKRAPGARRGFHYFQTLVSATKILRGSLEFRRDGVR